LLDDSRRFLLCWARSAWNCRRQPCRPRSQQVQGTDETDATRQEVGLPGDGGLSMLMGEWLNLLQRKLLV
jgi:hypothetical protein